MYNMHIVLCVHSVIVLHCTVVAQIAGDGALDRCSWGVEAVAAVHALNSVCRVAAAGGVAAAAAAAV